MGTLKCKGPFTPEIIRHELFTKQECIPVGCVPSSVPGGGGESLSGGRSLYGGSLSGRVSVREAPRVDRQTPVKT